MQRKGEEKTMIKKAFAIGLALTMSVTSPMPVMADENMETQESVFDDSGDMDSIEEENSSEEQNGVNEFSSGDVNNEVEQDEQTDSEQEWSSGAEEDTFSATSDVSDFDYSIDGVTGTATIKGYNGTDSVVYIPQTVEGYTVTSVGGFKGNRTVTKVIVPDGVTEIQKYCFYNCVNLEEVDLPDSITSLGDNCFSDCINLSKINIPRGLKEMGYSVFYNTPSLTSALTIPEGVEKIQESTFERCGVEEINLPNSLTFIGNNAFCKSGLKSIVIPKKVSRDSGWDLLQGCKNLNLVDIRGDIYISDGLFEDCPNLKSVICRNKDIIFFDSVSWTTLVPSQTCIYGYSDSNAYKYAKENGNSFMAIDVPTNVKCNKTDATTVKLTWNSISKSAQYKIYRSMSENGQYSVISTTKDTQYVDSGLDKNSKYYYKICATYNTGSTDIDGIESAIVVGNLNGKPDAPKIKSVGSWGSNTIKVTWKKVSGAVGYRIYRKTSANGKFKILTTVKNVSSYIDKKAVGGKTYFYTVQAYTKDGSKTVWGDYDTKGVSGYASRQPSELGISAGRQYSSFDVTGDGINDKFYAKWSFSGRNSILTFYINGKKSGTVKVYNSLDETIAEGRYELELCTLSSDTKNVFLSVKYQAGTNDVQLMHKLYKCKTGKMSKVFDVQKTLKIASMQSSGIGKIYSNGITFLASGIGRNNTRRNEQWIYAMNNGKFKLAKKQIFS